MRVEKGLIMRFVFMLVLIAGCVLGLGIYRGWFHFASDSAAGTSNVTLSVDNNKIQEDKNKVVDKTQELGHEAEAKTTAVIDKSKGPATQP
jgi:hypothetical protein